MFFQLLFAEPVAGLRLLQFDVLVLTALALFNYTTSDHDTVWDVQSYLRPLLSETEPRLIVVV